MEGSGGLLLLIMGTEGEVSAGSSVSSLHSALISRSSSTEDKLLMSSSCFIFLTCLASLSMSLMSLFCVASFVSFFFLDLDENLVALAVVD